MSAIIIVPARYASTRYPGKPLVALAGARGDRKTSIERSWQAAMAVKGADRVVVATDDDRIRDAAERFGAEVVMTSSDCRNGTERCAEVMDRIGGGYDIVANLQGDAPLTPPWFVEALIAQMRAGGADVATPVLCCSDEPLANFQEDRRHARVGGTTAVFDAAHRALYFSKEVLPFADKAGTIVYHHVGVYAYTPAALKAYMAQPEGRLEQTEGLEQLRFLEHGMSIQCVEVEAKDHEFWELNNPEDVPRIEAFMKRMDMS